MIRRWGWPLLLGLALGVVAYHVMLVQTPRLLMTTATYRIGSAPGTSMPRQVSRVLVSMVTHRISGVAHINTFTQSPLATSDSRVIVRPSPDLAYSSCPFDLSKGPVLIDVAPVPAPYWSLSVFDPRTDVAFVRNNVQAGGRAIRIALIGDAGGRAPPGYEPVAIKGNNGIALVRTLIDDRARFPRIDAARRASRCRSMSAK